ncbi:MAG TPA: Na(+)/H(+) antiporter subunit B [Hellea balneolensis]|uniref:Na(+)/H(+) antiporter subunit B n=1 Tax=Hellea balneolensis TaxID=287478 RepID=A0A7C5LYB6_9PROT|nr:Na(+)/H(+) antiporter subunit B [Hellea balneolensis]
MNPHVILRVVSKILIPLIALFAFYVQFHGDFGPGGGFQAGVILASSVILYALIFGLEAAKKAVPPSWVRIGMTLGVILYGGTGVATWLLGGEFLNYTFFAPDSTHAAGQHWGIFTVELGVLCTVTSAMVAIFYAFGSRMPDIADEDW